MLNFHPAADLFPLLEGAEYEALKANIEANGLRVPIILDRKTGTVLDGRNRYRACRELGIDYTDNLEWFDDGDPFGYVISMNLHRRHLGPVAWARIYQQECERRGIRLGEGGDRRSPASDAGDSAESVAAELGVAPRTARNRVALAEKLESAPDLAAKVDSGGMTAKRAERVLREREAEKKRAEPAPKIDVPASIDLRLGDFREVLADLPDGCVDLIFTDPPYPKKYLNLWEDLGILAFRLLRPSGLLVTYVPHEYLPQIMRQLGSNLTYVWIAAIVQPGPHNQMIRNRIRIGFKPILIYSNGAYDPASWFEDTVSSEGRSKDRHEWEQSVGPASYFLKKLCTPGGLVVDPFVGSGTTALAANQLGLRFIGAEADAATLRSAKERVRGN